VIQQAPSRLHALADADATIAPLARLQIAVLDAARDPSWEAGLPVFGTHALTEGHPVLHGATLGVDSGLVEAVWHKLIGAFPPPSTGGDPAIANGSDLFVILAAAARGDDARLRQFAADFSADGGLITTLGHLLAIPLLQACGRKATAPVSAVTWDHGWCPVCAAWPTVSEIRGLERQRWLRCGVCGTAWTWPQLACIYCGNTDYRTLGYLASETQRDARRAETCDGCGGYLKAVASFGPFGPADLLAADLETVELDVAALDQSYSRPETRRFRVSIHVESLGHPGQGQPEQARVGASTRGSDR
jgi:FdhE protein